MVKKKNKLKHKGGSNMTAYMQCSKRSAPHMKKGDPHIVTSTASHSKRIVDHIKNAQKYQTSHMSHYQKGGYAIKAKCDSVKKVSHTATPIKSTSVASASNPTYPGGSIGVNPHKNTNTINHSTAKNLLLHKAHSVYDNCVPKMPTKGPGALAPVPKPEPPPEPACFSGGGNKIKKQRRRRSRRRRKTHRRRHTTHRRHHITRRGRRTTHRRRRRTTHRR